MLLSVSFRRAVFMCVPFKDLPVMFFGASVDSVFQVSLPRDRLKEGILKY